MLFYYARCRQSSAAQQAASTGMAAAATPAAAPKMPTLERWLEKQRAALQQEREAERAEVADALSQLSPQVGGWVDWVLAL